MSDDADERTGDGSPDAPGDEDVDDERAEELARAAGDAFRDTAESGPETHVSERSIDDDAEAAASLGDADPGGGPRTHVSEESVDDMLDDIFDDDGDDEDAGTAGATRTTSPSDVDPIEETDDEDADDADGEAEAEVDDGDEAEAKVDDGGSGVSDDDDDAVEGDEEPLSADEVAQALADAESEDGGFGRPKTEGAEDLEESSDITEVDLEPDDVEISASEPEDDAEEATGGPLAGSDLGAEESDGAGGDADAADTDAATADGDGSDDDASPGLFARLKAWLFG